MTIKQIIDKIEERRFNHYSACYDANTYKICDAFESLHRARLISNKTYYKYKDFVKEVKTDIYNLYTMCYTEKEKEEFLKYISK